MTGDVSARHRIGTMNAFIKDYCDGNNKTQRGIVRLLDPDLCSTRRFAAFAMVKLKDGSSREMMHCKRADCDN
jgi:hypothetical protein